MLGRLFTGPKDAADSDRDDLPDAQDQSHEETESKRLLYGTLPLDNSLSTTTSGIRVLVLAPDHILFDSESACEPEQQPPARPACLRRDSAYARSPHAAGPSAVEGIHMNELREMAFGAAPVRFTNTITKLHSVSDKSGRAKVVLTRLFKVSADTSMKALQGFPTRRGSLRRGELDTEPFFPDMDMPAAGPAASATPAVSSWNPQLTTKAAVPAVDSARKGASFRCALCVVLTPPEPAPDIVHQHWEEISYATSELQSLVLSKLVAIQSSLLEITNDSSAPLRPSFFIQTQMALSHDPDLNTMVRNYRHRLSFAQVIPRVLCGQSDWDQLRVLLRSFGDNFSSDLFLATALTLFIRTNQHLCSSVAAQSILGNPPTRVVVISSNPVVARHFIAILASLIPSPLPENVLHLMSEENSLSVASSQVLMPSDSNTSADTVSDHIFDVASDQFGSFYGNESFEPTCSARGWEIPNTQAGQLSKSRSVFFKPYKVKPPSFSSSISSAQSSLSGISGLSLSRSNSRFDLQSAVGSLRRSFTSASLSSLVGFIHSPEEYETPPSDASLSYDAPYPFVESWSRSANCASGLRRNATTVFPREYKSSKKDVLYMSTRPVYHESKQFENVLDMEVELDAADVGHIEDLPVILPPIVGHIREFHPEFALQAVPYSPDLEHRIEHTMKRDASVVGVPKWVKTDTKPQPDTADKGPSGPVEQLMSRCLTLNLKKREVCDIKLLRTCTTEGCKQKSERRILFCNGKTYVGDSLLQSIVHVADTLSAAINDSEFLASSFRSKFQLLA